MGDVRCLERESLTGNGPWADTVSLVSSAKRHAGILRN